MNHEGINKHRLNPEAGNPREVVFAKAWEKANKEANYLRLILGKGREGYLLESEIQVAATVIQWLGSNCGMWFLRDIIKDNKEIRELVNSLNKEEELRGNNAPIEILKDGRCGCNCGTPCPLGKTGSLSRCTKRELESAGVKTYDYCDY